MTASAALWKNDSELFALMRRELFTAVVGDIMDRLGAQRQFLPPEIRPLRPDMVTVGRAMTVLGADILSEGTSSGRNPVLDRPFGLMLEALDDLKQDEIYVCAGASGSYALWGELMTTRAKKCGAAGAVVDGYLRDTHQIAALNFPAFSRGSYAQDQAPRGKVIDFRVSLRVGAAEIRPGDILFGDVDGVCVIPRAMEREVLAKALEKARTEKVVRTAIEAGMSAGEAFAHYGVL